MKMANGDRFHTDKMRNSVNCPPAKRTKLDNVIPVPKIPADDIWGEDLNDDVVDQCFFLASQNCSSFHNTTVIAPSTKSHLAPTVCKDPPFYKPNVQKNNSNGEKEDKERETLKANLKRIQSENEKLKESTLTKEGEVLILRRQLKQSEAKANTMLQIKSKEFEDKIKTIRNDLEKAKTTMELQKLEAWKATDRLLLAQSSQCASHVLKPIDVPELKLEDECFIFKSKVNQSCGSILNDLVNPHLFGKSELEIHQVELESKFSLQVSTTNRKKVNWRPSLYPLRLSVESCWVSVNQLGLEDSFQTMKSKNLIRKVFTECRDILCDLVLTLRDRAREESVEELDRRDRQLIETAVESLDDPKLLSNQMWYDVERGLEARRALGLLSVICMLSEYMSNLVCGVVTDKQVMSDITSTRTECEKDIAIKKPTGSGPHNVNTFVFIENKSTGNNQSLVNLNGLSNAMEIDTDIPVGESNLSDKELSRADTPESQKIERKEQEMRDLYEQQEFGFLRLLQNLTQIIGDQRNAFEYSGCLTGVVTLLTKALYKGNYLEPSYSIVNDTIRAVVFSRPRVEAVVALSELLYSFSSNLPIMEALCHSLESKAYIDIACGLGYFRTNSCVIQIFCWLLEKRNTSLCSRTRLCRGVINWLGACIKQRPHRGPKWAQCKQANDVSDPCFCRARLAEVTVKLIYGTFKDFEQFANAEEGESLRKTLVGGLMLLHQLTETDQEFCTHMQEAEGSYQWLLIGLRNTPHDLCLDKDEDEALRELLAMEDATEPRPFVVSEETQQHFFDICSTMKLCWTDQTINHNFDDSID